VSGLAPNVFRYEIECIHYGPRYAIFSRRASPSCILLAVGYSTIGTIAGGIRRERRVRWLQPFEGPLFPTQHSTCISMLRYFSRLTQRWHLPPHDLHLHPLTSLLALQSINSARLRSSTSVGPCTDFGMPYPIHVRDREFIGLSIASIVLKRPYRSRS